MTHIVGPHKGKEDTLQERINALGAAGYIYEVAEALAENGHDAESAKRFSGEQVFGLYLHWNGIIGYTSSIINALDNCRNVEAL